MERAGHLHTVSLPLMPGGAHLFAVPDELIPDLLTFRQLRFILYLDLYSKVSASERWHVYCLYENQLFWCT